MGGCRSGREGHEPKTLPSEGAVVLTRVDVPHQAAGPLQWAWSGLVAWSLAQDHSGWAESSCQRLVEHQRRRHHEATLAEDAMHGLNWQNDARIGSDTHSCHLQELSGSAMSETTPGVCSVAQTHQHSGKDSSLHSEVAPNDQATLAPYQKGRVSVSSRLESQWSWSSARSRPYLEGSRERMLADTPLVRGPPVVNHGISTRALAAAQSSTIDSSATWCFGDLWCADDGASRKLDCFCRKEKQQAPSHCECSPRQHTRCLARRVSSWWSRIELHMVDGEGSIPIHCGTADVQDAFHRVEIAVWLSRLFGMPAVRASEVGEECAHGQAVNADDMLASGKVQTRLLRFVLVTFCCAFCGRHVWWCADFDSGCDTNASQSAGARLCWGAAPQPIYVHVGTQTAAPVIEYVAPVSVSTLLEPLVPAVVVMQVPQVQVIEKTVELPFDPQFLEAPETVDPAPDIERVVPTPADTCTAPAPGSEDVTFSTPAPERNWKLETGNWKLKTEN